MKNKVHLIDCMEFMKTIPDKHYDLAIVDPPYGIGLSFSNEKEKKWNDKCPGDDYFNEIVRISEEQIIWGVSYFPKIPGDNGGRIVWNKKIGFNNKMQISACDIAFYSKHKRIAYFEYQFYGNVQQGFINLKNEDGPNGRERRIHPTQKPVALYKWLLQNYAKPGQTIFDSHVGSGLIRIACHDMGFDFEGCELDPDYYEAQEKRFVNYIKQDELFEKKQLQTLMFNDSI